VALHVIEELLDALEPMECDDSSPGESKDENAIMAVGH
jgi:hypothetical protein